MKRLLFGMMFLSALSFTFFKTNKAEAGYYSRTQYIALKNSVSNLQVKANHHRVQRNIFRNRARRCSLVRGTFARRCMSLRATANLHQRKLNRVNNRLSLRLSQLRNARLIRTHRRTRRHCVVVRGLFGTYRNCSTRRPLIRHRRTRGHWNRHNWNRTRRVRGRRTSITRTRRGNTTRTTVRTRYRRRTRVTTRTTRHTRRGSVTTTRTRTRRNRRSRF